MEESSLKLIFHMNVGTDKFSYAENSSLQRLVMQKSMHILEQSIRELLLGKYSNINLLPNSLNIADLGCSSGPNAFFAVKQIINSINKTCEQLLNTQPPSIQVFLNDLITNDFNTLFPMIPNFYEELEKWKLIVDIGREGGGHNKSCCYIAAVPGSFYGRLFPDESIQFLHSSNSLHWLSQIPDGLVSEFGEPLNKNNICMAETSPPSVREAYKHQFEKDLRTFLRMRCRELVTKGHMVLTLMCNNDKDDGKSYLEILGNTVQEMVSMGRIAEGELATFNVPLYTPSIEELKKIIKVEGSFTLKCHERFKLKLDENKKGNGKNKKMHVAMTIRAVLESLLTSHFGENCITDLFEMYEKNISEYLKSGKGIINIVTLHFVKGEK